MGVIYELYAYRSIILEISLSNFGRKRWDKGLIQNYYIKVNIYINCGYLPIFFLYSLKSVNEIRLRSDMNINKLKFIKV